MPLRHSPLQLLWVCAAAALSLVASRWQLPSPHARRSPGSMTVPSSMVNASANAAPKATLWHSSDASAPNATATDRRRSCQIVYVLGVEGSNHHGVVPILWRLAEAQADPTTGEPFHVRTDVHALRAAMFGFKGRQSPPINDTRTVRETLDRICPPTSTLANESSKMHVIIEGNSFPSGSVHNKHSRVGRQERWFNMSPEEIAADEAANNHPINLHEFNDAYSPYVDVKFIVLHRPYLETIASHPTFDGGPEGHSNVISGFLLILRRFLTSHLYSATNSPLWTMVCADKLSSKQYPIEHSLAAARENVIRHLADFMEWPVKTCPSCFDEWKESGKVSPAERLGRDATNVVMDHMERLVGIWPPRREEDGLPEQQCEM